VRSPLADGTLVRIPESLEGDEKLLTAIFPLTDVMATGHHAAICAGVERGSTCVVIGDGAVGLCGVLAARRLGAERIIIVGHHQERLAIARDFGATHVISSRGDEAVGEVAELTTGGANHVMECVGAGASMDQAIQVARPGGTIGYVGVPHGVQEAGLDVMGLFFKQLTLRGGAAPARAYMEELMADVIDGSLDPSPVFDMKVGLEGIPDGYAAMNERRALKVLVRI